MNNFEKEVPFDPGWSKFSTSFIEYVDYTVGNIFKLKTPNQIKFQMIKHEAGLVKKTRACVSIYLGCILWGGYLKSKFKDSPKVIKDNPTGDMPAKEAEKKFAYNEEPEYMIDYIDKFNKNCKRYAKRSSKIDSQSIPVLKAYLEFLELNHHFAEIKTTDQIQLPAVLSHFEKLSVEKLDELKDKIFSIIENDKIEEVLDLGFFTE